MNKILKISLFLLVLVSVPQIASATHHTSQFNTYSTHYFGGSAGTPLDNTGSEGWGPYPMGDARYSSNNVAYTDRVYFGVPFVAGFPHSPGNPNYYRENNWSCSMVNSTIMYSPYGCPKQLPMDWYHWWVDNTSTTNESKWTITDTGCYGPLAYILTDVDGSRNYYCNGHVIYYLQNRSAVIVGPGYNAEKDITFGNPTSQANAGPGYTVLAPPPPVPEDCDTIGDEDGNGFADGEDPVCFAPPGNPDFTITIGPPSTITVNQGQAAVYAIHLESKNNMVGSVDLTQIYACQTGFPADCTISPLNVPLTSGGTGSATYTVNTRPTTPPTTTGQQIAVKGRWTDTGFAEHDAFGIININTATQPVVTADIKVSDAAYGVVNSDGPITTYYGPHPVTLSWASTGATSCTVTSNANGDTWTSLSNGGVGTSPLTDNSTTYTISCNGGVATDSVTIKIPPPPTNLDYTCNVPNTSAHVTWTAPAGYNTFYVRVNPGFNNTVYNPPTTFLDDAKVGTSYDYPVTPTSQYTFFVHTREPSPNQGAGAYSLLTSKNMTCPIVAVQPVNGQCGGSVNSCTQGTFSDLTDSSTNYLWDCLGLNGGTQANPSCSLPIPPPPVPGICGVTLNSCTQGTFSDLTDNSTNYLWNCLGINGGANANPSCSMPIPPPATFNLRVRVFGQGNVSSAPSGINNCTTDCNANFDENITVTLTETPGARRIFTGWSGPCIVTSQTTCRVTMDASKTVNANFAIDPNFREF